MAIRLIAAILLLTLLSACATPPGVRLDTGQRGAPLEHRQAPLNKSVKVDANAFSEALTQLVLTAPLTLRVPQQGWLVRTSYPSKGADTHWQRLMIKSFGGICKPTQYGDNCLSMLDDVKGLSEWDKLGVALGLSIEPLKESIAKAVEKTLAPHLFYTVVATGLITWAILAANPEPVFTKAAAVVSALMLIYLGVETFLDVVDASRELKSATGRAMTWEELQLASQRFANRVGPEVARVFVLAVTVMVSHGMTNGAALLSSRLSMLPHFLDAATAGASRAGIHLANVGQVSAVAVVGSTVVISLPATAVAMGSDGGSGERASAAFGGPEELKWGNPLSRPAYGHTFLDHTSKPSSTRLADKARSLGHQIGQWTDDQAAAAFIANVAKRGPGVHDVPLPTGLGRSFLADGSELATDMARVVVKSNGAVRTAFPYNSAHPN
ncbi:hypothetical protein [Stigmatella aurantiaca]|uniref:Conserved uncharacterized protein n=1 Tax=Stigmatella aurantiaca (strain DW4/3-1) TaxID=378806 RepID=Q08W85_STIAD|nr:hypothetical protein [Stigmatella aurantiaca]ADO71749.1 conserved uncharacterized protein [Stigmatella aurantiaca DW4/3-1]EAU64731.1 hypothetical protein STIAU_2604 [Stigmatella aurantiaca DW4/3-1]